MEQLTQSLSTLKVSQSVDEMEVEELVDSMERVTLKRKREEVVDVDDDDDDDDGDVKRSRVEEDYPDPYEHFDSEELHSMVEVYQWSEYERGCINEIREALIDRGWYDESGSETDSDATDFDPDEYENIKKEAKQRVSVKFEGKKPVYSWTKLD